MLQVHSCSMSCVMATRQQRLHSSQFGQSSIWWPLEELQPRQLSLREQDSQCDPSSSQYSQSKHCPQGPGSDGRSGLAIQLHKGILGSNRERERDIISFLSSSCDSVTSASLCLSVCSSSSPLPVWIYAVGLGAAGIYVSTTAGLPV